MAIEFIGSAVPAGPGRQDPEYPLQAAALDEDAGFDKLLLGYGVSAPDALLVANEMLTATSRIGVVIAHAPGLVAPTLAARQFGTLAAFHRGRVAMHAITEFSAAGGPRDGDTCSAAAWPRQAAEFLEVVRLSWRSREPFDYSGEFYRLTGSSAALSSAGRDLPIYVSGESAAAVRAGAAQADIHVFAGAPAPVIAGRVASARAMTAARSRSLRFGVSLRLVTAPTERAARERYAHIGVGAAAAPWILPATIGASGGMPAIVGSYAQVAAVLLDYLAIGVSTLVLGHDPLADAADCAAVIALVSAAARRQGRGSACRPLAAAFPRQGSPA
jgi:alkanesulfonate monooxygenase